MNEVVNLLNFFHDKNQKNLDIFGNPTDGSYEEKIKNTILHELTYKLSFLIQQENKYCGISNLHFEWVDGYKIVSRSLTERNGYQYEIGKRSMIFSLSKQILIKIIFSFVKLKRIFHSMIYKGVCLSVIFDFID